MKTLLVWDCGVIYGATELHIYSLHLLFYANINAPINVMPHRPPPGQCWGIGGEIGGDLNFAKFKCTTYQLGMPVGQIPTFAPLNNRGKGGWGI